MKNSIVYHYCNNQKAISILQNRTIRLSDISKSNDFMEMKVFYPQILDTIYNEYKDNPFDFKYKGKQDISAIKFLLEETQEFVNSGFMEGFISNFVICFSEKSDMLSQWRGYANDGKGICIGFDKLMLRNYCNKNNKVLTFSKVEYIDLHDIPILLKDYAISLLKILDGLREDLVANITLDDTDTETDSLIGFNFERMIEGVITESLKYKLKGFKEECEWRMFLQDSHFKVPDWIFLNGNEDSNEFTGPDGFKETVDLLNGKLDFNVNENDIIPYFTLPIDDISPSLIKSITLGPKNYTRKRDLELLLTKYNYINNIDIQRSLVSYSR